MDFQKLYKESKLHRIFFHLRPCTALYLYSSVCEKPRKMSPFLQKYQPPIQCGRGMKKWLKQNFPIVIFKFSYRSTREEVCNQEKTMDMLDHFFYPKSHSGVPCLPCFLLFFSIFDHVPTRI